MDQADKVQMSYLMDLKLESSPSTYKQQLGQFLLKSGANYPDNEDIVDLFLEYAQLSEDFENTFNFMLQNSIGTQFMQFYHFFFQKLKPICPQKAMELLKVAKLNLYSDFHLIDNMRDELNEMLINQLERHYRLQNMNDKDIQQKLKQFISRHYQSKNKKIFVDMDNHQRRYSTSKLLDEFNKVGYPQQLNQNKSMFNNILNNITNNSNNKHHIINDQVQYKNQDIYSVFYCKDVNNPEEDEELQIAFKGIELSGMNQKKAIKIEIPPDSPSMKSLITTSSEIIDKMPSISLTSSSQSLNLFISQNRNLNTQSSLLKESNKKVIVQIPNILRRKQVLTECPKQQFKFSNIPKLRSVNHQDQGSEVKEYFLSVSPQ